MSTPDIPLLREGQPRLPVLVIEDIQAHADMIKSILEPQYDVTILTAYDPVQLLNFKALCKESAIIIIDKLLHDSKKNGIEIMEGELWPIDRSTQFIVFSQQDDEATLYPRHTPGANWVVVPKNDNREAIIDPKRLTQLRNVVDQCATLASPVFRTPTHDTGLYASPLVRRAVGAQDWEANYLKFVKDEIRASTTKLNELANFCSSFSRAGALARNVCVVVYGSTGRLETHPGSDIDFSVIVDTDDEGALDLGISCWNRIAYYCHRRNWAFEGSRRLQEQPGVLVGTHLNNGIIGDYQPVISRRAILTPGQDGNLRNRHFQLLTEARCIFNPDSFDDLRLSIIRSDFGGDLPTDLSVLLESATFLGDRATQFAMDTKGKAEDDERVLAKRLCARIVNLYALRLQVVGLLAGSRPLISTDDWNSYFEAVRDPSLVKVIRLKERVDAMPNLQPGDNALSQLRTLISELVDSHVSFAGEYSKHGASGAATSRAMELAERAQGALSAIKNMRTRFGIGDRMAWLFTFDHLDSDLNWVTRHIG